jgi:hypothetical protein
MNTWTLRARRTVIFAGTAALIGLTAAACQTGAQSTASPTSHQIVPTFTTNVSTSAPVPAPSKFPNTDELVLVTGYDAKNHLVEFQKLTQNPASQAAYLVPDPKDPAIHKLPMASRATINSYLPGGGFPFETCPPISCTTDDIVVSVIGHNKDSFYADIHVNAADQIDAVAQSDY